MTPRAFPAIPLKSDPGFILSLGPFGLGGFTLSFADCNASGLVNRYLRIESFTAGLEYPGLSFTTLSTTTSACAGDIP